jgi:hypothetical protein
MNKNEVEKPQWFPCQLTFNQKEIAGMFIEPHFKIFHPEFTYEFVAKFVIESLTKEKNLEPIKWHGAHKRDVFALIKYSYQDKKYNLIFWFENSNPNILWIKNFHQNSNK